MTIPINTEFSILNIPEKDLSSADILEYTRSLAEESQTFNQLVAETVNGYDKVSFLDEPGSNRQANWTPTLAGTTTAGSFTYVNRYGWTFRQGLLTDAWFDISWTSAGSAAGNLYLELPYKVAKMDGMPFVGVLQTSTINYGVGTVLTCNAIPDTTRCEIWTSGSAVTTANITVAAAGRLIGTIRYMGTSNE